MVIEFRNFILFDFYEVISVSRFKYQVWHASLG